MSPQSVEDVPPFIRTSKDLIPWNFRWKRLPVVRQHSLTDCGAACLATVARYYGKYLSLSRLREQSHTGRAGTSMLQLLETAQELKLEGVALQATYDHLLRSDHPSIVNWQGYHWMVLYKVRPTKVLVADPAHGEIRWISRDAFIAGWTRYVLYLAPTPEFRKIPTSKPSLQSFNAYVKPYRFWLAEVFLASAMFQILSVGLPLFSKFIIDDVIIKQRSHWLFPLVLIMVLWMGSMLLLNFFKQNLLLFASLRINLQMVQQFYRHLLTLPIPFFQHRKTGDILSRFQENEKITSFFTQIGPEIFLNLMTAVLYLGMMFYFNVALSGLTYLFLSFHAVVLYWVTPYLQNSYRDAFQKEADNESHLIESLRGRSTIKALGIENSIRWEWENYYAKYSNAYFKTIKYGILSSLITQIINHFSEISVLLCGAWMVMHRQLTIGELVAFTMLARGASSPVIKLVGVWDSFQESLNAVERLNDVLEKDPEESLSKQKNSIKLPSLQGHIQLEKVTFRYDAEGKNIIQNLSFEVFPGQLIGVVGRSGSGKSTLIKLLAGFYQPSSGVIAVDGFPLNQVDLESFRRQLGVVFQDRYLFSDTILGNMTKAVGNVPFVEVVAAAQKACAHDFIFQMPQGYQSLIEAQGHNLSGGQAQRIALARAFLGSPKILILDEATSALDPETENQVLKNLKEHFPNTTILMVAHRLETIRDADQILVLEYGHLVEHGTHEELLKKQQLYAHLWSSASLTKAQTS